MIDFSKLIIVIPSLLPFTYEAKAPHDCYSYPICSDCEPQLKNTMEYNTMNMRELIENNNNDIMEAIFMRSVLEDEQ